MIQTRPEIALKPGQRPILGSRTLVGAGPDSPVRILWLRMGNIQLGECDNSLVSLAEFRSFYEDTLRKVVHLPGQDEETRLWAVEKFSDARMDVANMAGLTGRHVDLI